MLYEILYIHIAGQYGSWSISSPVRSIRPKPIQTDIFVNGKDPVCRSAQVKKRNLALTKLLIRENLFIYILSAADQVSNWFSALCRKKVLLSGEIERKVSLSKQFYKT